MNIKSELCEYHKIEKKIKPDLPIGLSSEIESVNVVREGVCMYNEEYYQRTNCNGQRAICAYPEKWEK